MKSVRIYTDGSCLGNPGHGGWCAILVYGDKEKIIKGKETETTNNRMELTAAIEGLSALKTPCEVELFSDSSYVVNGINQWLEGWARKDFQKIKNPDLWKKMHSLIKIHKVKAVWIKGHNGHKFNERCDRIANEMAAEN